MMKKLFSLLLVVLLLVSMLPMSVFAAEGDTVTVNVTVLDKNGNALSGVPVSVRNVTNNMLSKSAGSTGSNGVASVTFSGSEVNVEDRFDCDPGGDYEWGDTGVQVRWYRGGENSKVYSRSDKHEDATVTGSPATINFEIRVQMKAGVQPDTYTWYGLDGETVLKQQSVTKGQINNLPTAPELPAAATPDTAEFDYYTEWKAIDSYSWKAVETSSKNSYPVYWVVEGTTVKTDTLEYGATPSYTGMAPVKEGNAQYSYNFTGWTPAIAAVTGEATYTAVFEQATNQYTVIWQKEDGSELKTETLAYGATPACDAPAAGEDKVFAGWKVVKDGAVTGDALTTLPAVSGDVTYRAVYADKFTVTFKYNNGVNEDSTMKVAPNGTVTAPAAPSREKYKFDGWFAENADTAFDFNTPITSDLVLTAKWTQTQVNATITIKVEDQNGLPIPGVQVVLNRVEGENQTPLVTLGATDESGIAVYSGGLNVAPDTRLDCDPVAGSGYKWDDGASVQVRFLEAGFTGVTKFTSPQSGNLAPQDYADVTESDIKFTFRLKMDHDNMYTIEFEDENGTDLQVPMTVAQGVVPLYIGEAPTKAADAQYTYTFKGWKGADDTVYEGALPAASANVTYTPYFEKTVNKYDVHWVVEGATVKTDSLEYGATPSYTGETPTKAADADYTYVFEGWDPAIESVTGEATYTAKFKAIERCKHELHAFGYCAELENCTHDPDCTCKPNQQTDRVLKIITKDASWNRIGGVDVVLMQNDNKGNHTQLGVVKTNESGEITITNDILKNVVYGASLYIYPTNGYDFAYNTEETCVRQAVGGVNSAATTGLQKSLWTMCASDAIGFTGEMTIFVKAIDRVDIHLKVVDQNGLPMQGIVVDVKGCINNGPRSILGTVTTDVNGHAVLTGDTASLKIQPGMRIDCDPIEADGFKWDFTQGKVRFLEDNFTGVTKFTSPQSGDLAPQDYAVVSNDTINFTFKCIMTHDEKYTIKFVDGETTLKEITVAKGVVPSCDLPTKEGHTAAWDKPIVAATADATYTVVYACVDHVFDEWSYDEDGHWQECERDCGEATEPEDHKFGDWKVTKKATETTNGQKERVCSVCGYVETAKIPYTDKNNPDTGDNSSIIKMAGLFGASVAGAAAMIVLLKKREKEEA